MRRSFSTSEKEKLKAEMKAASVGKSIFNSKKGKKKTILLWRKFLRPEKTEKQANEEK